MWLRTVFVLRSNVQSCQAIVTEFWIIILEIRKLPVMDHPILQIPVLIQSILDTSWKENKSFEGMRNWIQNVKKARYTGPKFAK